MSRPVIAIALSALLSVTLPSIAAEKAKPVAAKKKTAVGTPEYAKAGDALRVIEAKVQTGINYPTYSQELGQLNVSLSGLEEVAEAYADQDVLLAVRKIRMRYMLVKEVWSICRDTPSLCIQSFVRNYSETDPLVSQLVKPMTIAFELHPDLRKPMAEGGAETDAGYSTGIVVAKLWSDAAEAGKQLRAMGRR